MQEKETLTLTKYSQRNDGTVRCETLLSVAAGEQPPDPDFEEGLENDRHLDIVGFPR